jgi:hypothetical protein
LDHPFAGPDGVHPTPNGHLAMAYAFLKALGCDGSIGTITVDLAAGTAEASAGHQVMSCAHGEVQLSSTRYPFCFNNADVSGGDAVRFGGAVQPNRRSAIEFLPFNQDLNRLTLMVTHASSENLAVTWGTQTKIFSAAILANGINLAAEFLDNPFVPFFSEVESHVFYQQAYENVAAKHFLLYLPEYNRILPAEKETWSHLVGAFMAHDQELRLESVHSLKPVLHRIIIAAAK